MASRTSVRRGTRLAGGGFPNGRRFGALGTAFTLVELLTVIAIIGVVATLITSGVSVAQKRSRQATCNNNLRQLGLAVEVYSGDTGRRPRSVTRLTRNPVWLANPKSLLCPQDPYLQSGDRRIDGSTNAAWGNLANESQEPAELPDPRDLDEPSWEAEIGERRESVRFSFLHPLGWRRLAWLKLNQHGNQVGVAVCQLHGVRISNPRIETLLGKQPFLAWEGLTFRAQRDGSVLSRRLFRGLSLGSMGAVGSAAGVAVVPWNPNDYPWEFYTDSWESMQRSKQR